MREANRIKTIYSEMNKKNSGITLVALVVTIVVLLILAGVSINLVVGQNGLINRAKEAARKTQETAKEEQKEFDTATNYIKQTIGVSASGITAEDYGKVVTNYNADGKTWEIFYADKENVYLITRESCGNQSLSVAVAENSGYNGASDFDGSEEFKKKYPAVQAGWLNKTYTPSASGAGTLNYTSTNLNMMATEYLLDSSIWNTDYKANKADWAIGAPTLELFVAAYNKIYEDKAVTIGVPTGNGYKYDDVLFSKNSLPESDSVTTGTAKSNLFNHGYAYWIACSSSYSNNTVRHVRYDSAYVGYNSYTNVNGVRPVVCLNSGVTLTPSEDRNTFTIN